MEMKVLPSLNACDSVVSSGIGSLHAVNALLNLNLCGCGDCGKLV